MTLNWEISGRGRSPRPDRGGCDMSEVRYTKALVLEIVGKHGK